jgi:hypothetical protein
MSDNITMKGLFGIMDRLYLTHKKSFDAILTKDTKTLNNSKEDEVA